MLGLCALAVAGVVVHAPATSHAEDFSQQNRVRIAWRGSAAVAWHGTLSVSSGKIVDCQPLGTEPQVSGSIVTTSDGVHLNPLRPSYYHAVDLTIVGDDNAMLQLQLRDPARSEFLFDQSVLVDQVVREGVQIKIDEETTLLARSAPGDELRVQFTRDQLVFSPREVWQLDVAPAPRLLSDDGGRLVAELFERGARRPLWRTRTSIPGDPPAAASSIQRLTIPIPDREGVFDLSLSWTSEQHNSPFGGKAPSSERRIQFVVVENQPTRNGAIPSTDEWPTVFRMNAGQSDWWKRTKSLTRWNRAGSELDVLLHTNDSEDLDTDPARYDPGEHRAEVISIRNPDRPHLLELTCTGEPDAGLMVAIMEADEQGQLDWHNAAGSFVIEPLSVDIGAQPQVYRLLFWPRTRRPIVYLSNVRRRGWIQFESLRVLEGPGGLPSANLGPPSLGRRKALAWITDPHLLNTFSPPELRDPATGRGMTDWLTFLTTATRLTDYLHYAGYAGTCINVWCDGGAIFPARALQGSSRWDNGAYFANGQDPVPKDVLELYLRVFDREGLTFIPGLCFNSRLPTLEHALRTSAQDSVGIELTHRDGRSWRSDPSQRDGRGAFYNPLDSRVQDAMIGIVREIARRYAHHPSFTGVQIELANDAFAVLPNASWGYDQRTMSAFWRTARPGEPEPAATELATLLYEPGSPMSEVWRMWRCEQLAAFYARMTRELQSVRPDLQLHLATGKLAQAPNVLRACAPALPRRLSALSPLIDMGIDPRQLAGIQGLVVARPWIMDSGDTLVGQGPLIEWNRDSEIDSAFSQPAALLFERVQMAPFRPVATAAGTPRWLIAPSDRMGIEQRGPLARSLVNRDANLLLIGGAQPSLGELDATRDFLKVFAMLPAERFEQPDSVAAKPVTLRTCTIDSRTYLYVVNRAPWSVKCRLDLSLPVGTRLMPISAKDAAQHVVAGPNGLIWEFSLDGYGLEAALIPEPDVVISELVVEDPPEVEVALHSLRSEVIGRMPRLQSLEPISSLVNPGFERLAAESNEIAGWELCQDTGVRIDLDSQQYYSGASSLRMQSTANSCWVRSDPIEPPRTGRLSLHLQLRRQPECNAPLRLTVEGLAGDRPFHRFAEITSLESTPASGDWAPIVLQVTDLPDKHLQDLRVRFDLLGPGEVWIDDVRLYDLSFTPKELNELTMIVSVADLQLSEGELAKCYNTLRRYWPRYLLSLVPPPPPRMAAQPETVGEAPNSADATNSNGTFTIPKLPWR